MAASRRRKKKSQAEKQRKPLKPRVMFALRAALGLAGAVAAIALAAFGASAGYEAAVRERYFDVREVEITGLRVVRRETVAALLGPVAGKNAFELDLKGMGGRIESDPWVKSVEIRRKLPSTLLVEVTERKPAAVVRIGGRWLVDGEGVLLMEAPEDAQLGLPLLTGLGKPKGGLEAGGRVDPGAVASAIAALRRLDGFRLLGKSAVAGMDLSRPGRIDIFFEGTDTVVTAPRAGWTDEAERLRVVDHILRKKERPARSINLIFADKVIVTGLDAQAG